MTLNELQPQIVRAMHSSLQPMKLLATFGMLLLIGILFVFFNAMGLETFEWAKSCLKFISWFLSCGIVLSCGSFFIRIYREEVNQRKIDMKEVLQKSLTDIPQAFLYLAPIILCYLVLWFMLGAFLLMKATPAIGDFFGSIFASAPFLFNVGTIVLSIACAGLVYFIPPLLAFKNEPESLSPSALLQEVWKNPIHELPLLLIALTPLIASLLILFGAAGLTDEFYAINLPSMYVAIRAFFVMVPFMALLAPSVLFFFNFSAEAYVMRKKNHHD